MTSKEKANELYNKFYNTDSHGNSVKVRESLAKHCALLAVDEILSLMVKFHGRHIEDNLHEISYWQEVKTEIEKL